MDKETIFQKSTACTFEKQAYNLCWLQKLFITFIHLFPIAQLVQVIPIAFRHRIFLYEWVIAACF